MSALARLAALPVRAYRLAVSPWLGCNCRYLPTCSAYALEALETHGARKGAALAAARIARCHPWGGSGVDNVPAADPPEGSGKASRSGISERSAASHPDGPDRGGDAGSPHLYLKFGRDCAHRPAGD